MHRRHRRDRRQPRSGARRTGTAGTSPTGVGGATGSARRNRVGRDEPGRHARPRPRRRADLLALRAADARAVGEQRSRPAAAAGAAGAVGHVHRRSAGQQLLQQRAPAVHDVGVVVRLRDRRRDTVPAGGARRDRAVAGHGRHHGRRDVHPQLRPARLPARPHRRRRDDLRHVVLVGRDDLRQRQRVRGRRSARHRDDAAVAVLHLSNGVRGGRAAADRLRGGHEAVLPAAQHDAGQRAAGRGEGGQPEHARRHRRPGPDDAGRDAGADRVPALPHRAVRDRSLREHREEHDAVPQVQRYRRRGSARRGRAAVRLHLCAGARIQGPAADRRSRSSTRARPRSTA